MVCRGLGWGRGFSSTLGAIMEEKMDKAEATRLLEDVLDILQLVEFGAAKSQLVEAVDKLYRFRNEWFRFVEDNEKK